MKMLLLAVIVLFLACTQPTNRVENAVALIENSPHATASKIPNVTIGTDIGADYLMGKFDPETHEDFEKIGAPYSDKSDMYLRKETAEAFKKMWKAAKADGINLNVISATRNFERQKTIWENKWKKYAKEVPDAEKRALKILEYSSMPGTSRHHWGTDMDLNSLESSHFEKGKAGEKVYNWLSEHAHEYGFCQPYSPKGAERPDGYKEEKWHWSYKNLSEGYLNKYTQKIDNQKITGFKGSETAATIDVVKKYVSGIAKVCK